MEQGFTQIFIFWTIIQAGALTSPLQVSSLVAIVLCTDARVHCLVLNIQLALEALLHLNVLLILWFYYLSVQNFLKGNVCCPYRWSRQPAVLVFGAVHVPVKGIELTVAEMIHIHQVKLPPGVVVALIVAFSGEIQPLRMAKLISCNTENVIKDCT